MKWYIRIDKFYLENIIFFEPCILKTPSWVSTVTVILKCYHLHSCACRDSASDRAVEDVLAAKGKQQKELLGNLLEDEKYQRDAFAALFVKQDSRHREICSQVENIQSELASLTMVEMTKKDLKVRKLKLLFSSEFSFFEWENPPPPNLCSCIVFLEHEIIKIDFNVI